MFDKNINKFAYTLAEMLLALAIVAVLAMIAIPTAKRAIPNKEEKLHQKASYLIEQVVSGMYDNKAYYPITNDVTKFGFHNTDAVSVDGVQYGGGADDSTARKEKFCRLFALQFSTVEKAVTCPVNIYSDEPSFKTADGIEWWIPQTTFNETVDDKTIDAVKIKVDINGRDKGRNCSSEGSHCDNPDVFFYYIKANGAITLSNPTDTSSANYSIIVQPTTKDSDGNTVNTSGGNVYIAELTDDIDDDDYSNEAEDFTNLKPNTYYMLKAVPNTGYLSNWMSKTGDKNGYKKVRTAKLKNKVNVVFSQIPKYCIKVKVKCPDNDTSCIASKLCYKNCNYTSVGAGNGDYTKTNANLEIFEYVGSGEGDYKYQCDATPLTMVDGSTSNGDYGYVKICDLVSGDYQVYIAPKSGYHVDPDAREYFQQDVRLGTADLSDFEVNISED